MKLILSSCDFGNPTSARFITNHLCKPISACKVLYFPNEKATPEKIRSGKYEARVAAFGFQRKNIYVANYFDPAPFWSLDIDVIYISGGNTFGTMKRIRDSGLPRNANPSPSISITPTISFFSPVQSITSDLLSSSPFDQNEK